MVDAARPHLHPRTQPLPSLRWCDYPEAKNAADKKAEAIRITIGQEVQVRGRGAQVTQSPQTVIIDSESLATELAQHANLSSARLLDALCSVLADAPPFAILVDTYEAAAHASDPQFKESRPGNEKTVTSPYRARPH